MGGPAPPEPPDEEGEEEYEVDTILKKRIKKGKTEYFVRWKYYNDTTWEPEENLQNVRQMIEQFEKKVMILSGLHLDFTSLSFFYIDRTL